MAEVTWRSDQRLLLCDHPRVSVSSPKNGIQAHGERGLYGIYAHSLSNTHHSNKPIVKA